MRKDRKIKKTNLIALLAVFLFAVILVSIKPTITGQAVLEAPEGTEVFDEIHPLTGMIEVFPFEKSPDSSLNVKLEADSSVSVFVEIDDCDAWNNGKDRDTSVMQAVDNVETTEFNIGDLRTNKNSRQQVELYRTEKFCIVVINKNNAGSVRFIGAEFDNGQWDIR